ncbi:glycosyl transferase [Boudabousia liubingyangii]|uniref:Glycosyl transferase n=1 Tax=Boudabousia liubingyangii TaxID=1921764 RepID=A0A1Q5PKY0_9ACTO|nr:glycosyltransferase [Boudabousia liubingyangii]OKL47293.1 glycosyl transferase [Boudabousia liubingyangii]
MTSKFSVLMAVYQGDDPQYLRRSLESVTVEQALPPNQLVIVVDGPIGESLAAEVPESGTKLGQTEVLTIKKPKNEGLALALVTGLEHCEHRFVARHDADDISLPERFAKQIPLLEQGFELVGAAIQDMYSETTEDGLIRRHPSSEAGIKRAIKYRDPFNHPSVVYDREAVVRAGGYEPLDLMEDYWLFARMVHRGVKCTNLPDVLVRYRVSSGAYKRRGGFRLLRSEMKLQRLLLREGIITIPIYFRNVLIRGVYRLIPASVRKVLYKYAVKIWSK